MFTNEQVWLSLIRVCWTVLLAVTVYCSYLFEPWLALLVLPITAVGMGANRILLRSVASSREQALQAKRHVEELSHYLAEQERVGNILQKSEEKFRNAFDHASIGMALVSMSGDILKVNRAFGELLGVAPSNIISTQFASLLPEEDIGLQDRELTKLFYGAVQSTQIEIRIFRRNCEILWVLWSASLIPADVDEPSHYIFQFQDITDRKSAESRLAHDALHDGLTGLPNRTLFFDRLQVAFRRAQRGFNINFAVCCLDFDRFKLVNDSFGHTAGDLLLVEIAARLRSVLRASDTVARLGGDEFAILIEEISDLEEIIPTLERIREEVARPLDLKGETAYSTVSIGIATWAREYEHPEQLLRDADTAVYEAKRAGRDRYEFFSPVMHVAARESFQIETDLRDAIEKNQFEVFFQPIVTIESGRAAGVEALIRWNHPVRGLMSPLEFIPLAEETGMIFPIGEWVLRAACQQLSAWQRANPRLRDLWISVNVTAKQFTQVDLVSLVAKILKETGLGARSLKLELTESGMAENLDHVVDVMNQLKAIGVRLSIDDFGTGYSSLSNLHRLPLNSLKIDRAFVHQMQDSSEGDDIIRTIVSLAKSLDLSVIAEGVETESQLESLRSLECQMAQGYLFARPMDAEAAKRYLLAKWRMNTRRSKLAAPKSHDMEHERVHAGLS